MPARFDGPCRKCGSAVVRDSQDERKCPTCFAARKRQERQRAADKAGKPYTPGVPFWQAPKRRGRRGPEQVADTTWRRIEKANARQAWRWWLAHAPASWFQAHRAQWLAQYPTAGKLPGWYGRRYAAEPAFRQHEIRRIADRKARRGRFDEHVREVISGKRADKAMRRLLGYGRDELLAHLVDRFRPGMSLELLLAGAIHLDHDEPVSRFDPTDPAQLRHLWRLENLQPLWPIENARKSARTVDEWRAGIVAHRVAA